MKAPLLVITALILLAGCAQKTVNPQLSPAVEGVQRLERRAAIAYGKGDLLGAKKDYLVAEAVYASLALQEQRAITHLNLAKIESELSGAAFALVLTEDVVRRTYLSKETRLLAHGRAAALTVATYQTTKALKHLDAADELCANACESVSALYTLRSEALLIDAKPQLARLASDAALQLAKKDADKANALRSRASIGLAEGVEAVPQAIADAEQALAIDQQLGASARVIADLSVLEKAYALTGNAPKANSYKALRESAEAAREQLRLK
jgi:hypothetical protein